MLGPFLSGAGGGPGDGSTGGAGFTEVAWSTAAPVPVKRHEAFGGFVGGELYVFGGYWGAPQHTPTARVDRYDPVAGTWAGDADRPSDLPVGLTHAGMTIVGTDVYFAGGYPAQGDGTGQHFHIEDVWRYDTLAGAYTALPGLPGGRGGGALVHLDGHLHFFGGSDTKRVDAAEHWVLDLADQQAGWQAAPSLPTPRNHLGGVVLDGRIYAVGGQSGQDAAATYRADVHVYDPPAGDPTGGEWAPVASMPQALSHNNASTFVMDGRVVVAGGEIAFGSSTDQVVAYDPAADAWAQLTALPNPRNAGVADAHDGVLFHATGNTSTTLYRGVPQ